MLSQLYLCCLGLLCLCSASAESVRLATYNLNNYLVMDRHVGAVWRPSYPKPEAEKAIIREVIKGSLPDVLALQEMGTLPFLEELRADLAQDGVHYPYAIHMEGVDEVRHLAVLSKLPPVEVVKHEDLDFKYIDGRELVKRGMLEVSFERSDGSRFKLFVVHLKSRWTDVKADPDSQLRRTREAEACRNRIVERTYDMGVTDFIIAGDFNDHPGSGTLRRFYQRGRLKIGALVPASDSRGEQWTYYYHKQVVYSLVDGFVVSGSLSPQIEAGDGHIVDIPGALIGSDHRMVYLDLVESETTPSVEDAPIH
ncbi:MULTISPECIES: endonuclease/exonuclease/phosphatase family protein [unclassified Lentimonas]|uniref:endonuclease/exonuclease/phosphatase family protein n=1 Tax=unclassified Lentimonas TaxID=2630993 RepID=UPI00138A3594|nr:MULTISPECIES: endonuclease/exonuclease/phosphatase family protein [unclassified Lentimonas]